MNNNDTVSVSLLAKKLFVALLMAVVITLNKTKHDIAKAAASIHEKLILRLGELNPRNTMSKIQLATPNTGKVL